MNNEKPHDYQDQCCCVDCCYVRRREKIKRSGSYGQKCTACGISWTEHPGFQPTCEKYQVAMKTLRQIAEAKPANRGARRLAVATIRFLESQS